MTLRQHLRLGAATCLLAASLLSSWQLLQLVRAPKPVDVDNLYLNRLEAIKGSLPGRGVVCYMTGADTPFEAKKHYFLAQYALAPLVLRSDASCDWLIGDFPGAAPTAALNQQHLFVLHDFGDGLLLLRRSAAP